jgi:hypothetical protein
MRYSPGTNPIRGMMNARNLTIGGAVVLCLTTWITRVTGLVTDDQLLYLFWALLIVFGSMTVSYGISWAATDGYKKYNWKPHRWRDQPIKKKIFKFAWWSGGIAMFACGFFALILTSTGVLLAVYSFGWLILCVFVAFTSPWLWSFVFENLIPRMKRRARVRDEAEAEAMSRPNEIPRGDGTE